MLPATPGFSSDLRSRPLMACAHTHPLPSTSFTLITAPVLRLSSGLLHLLQEAFHDYLLPPQTQLDIPLLTPLILRVCSVPSTSNMAMGTVGLVIFGSPMPMGGPST